jgi:hypothetical protein
MLGLLLGDFTMGSIGSLITLAFEVPTYRIYTNRASEVHQLPPSFRSGKGTSVRHRIAEAGATFPAQAWTGRRAFLPSPPVSPSPAGRERGNALQGALPCAPTPLSHAVGEGLGVRAKKRARPAHSELKRCTLISSFRFPPLREGNQARLLGSPCSQGEP